MTVHFYVYTPEELREAWETITTATTDRGYTTDQLIEDIARQMST